MKIKEQISITRNIMHWVLAPAVLLVYSLVAFASILKFVFVGKKMAGHDMAAKEGLQTDSVLNDAVDAALINNQIVNEAGSIEHKSKAPAESKESADAYSNELLYKLGSHVHFGGYSERTHR